MKYVPENGERLAREIADAGIVTASLSCAPGCEASKIKIRPVTVKTGAAFQIERIIGTKAFHHNADRTETESELAAIFAAGVTAAEFLLSSGSARLVTLVSNRRGEIAVLKKKAPAGAILAETLTAAPGATLTAPDSAPSAPDAQEADRRPPSKALSHDRTKTYILAEGKSVPFLVDLGVMTADGSVIKTKYDKFRQINRFLEYIADISDELEKEAKGRELTVVDFGCGKSYLTFAVYYYLHELKGIPVRIIGLDLKDDVIAECSRLAGRYGYGGLSFTRGDIADYDGCDRADLVITLHACDTATDQALAKAVSWNAKAILSVPCCQHELNAQLARPAGNTAATGRGTAVLHPALRHGIIRERMAALFTDAMRAELLEGAGYRTQILEFIDMSHTPKNLLIRAVRQDKETGRGEKRLAEYRELRDFLGVAPTLDALLQALPEDRPGRQLARDGEE